MRYSLLSWRKIEGGVEKRFSWGKSRVFMVNFEDCFSVDELIRVRADLEAIDVNLPEVAKIRVRLRRELIEGRGR
uniref:Uncharacterized protein n=1 Tax=viral metagenome TaxID=1070528 RepID=A0A6M3LD75_9ZZZZ